jgi:hypothetical protein
MSEPCVLDPYSPCEDCGRCRSKRYNKHINVTQVYCTGCNNFELKEINNDYIPDCKYKDICDLRDCEDSKPFEDRPYYEDNGDLYE